MRVSPNYIASLVTGGAAALCIFAVLYSGIHASGSGVANSAKLPVADAASNIRDTGGQLADLPKEFDMGTIANDKVTEKTLTLANTGSGPLEIKDVQTSCGCTQAYFKDRRDQQVKSLKIPAGESATLFLSVDPFRVPGFTSRKICTIFTNDPDQKNVQFDVLANVDPEFVIDPEQLHLGTVTKGERASGQAVIRQMSGGDVDIKAVRAGARAQYNYSVELNPRPESEWTTPGKKEWTLDVALDSKDLNRGLFRDRVFVETNLKRLPTYSYMINVEVETFYSVVPELLHRREAVDPGALDVASAAVTSDQPIHLENIQSTDPAVEVAVKQEDSKNTATLHVNIKEDAAPGVKNATLSFEVVADDGSRAQHAIRAIVAVK